MFQVKGSIKSCHTFVFKEIFLVLTQILGIACTDWYDSLFSNLYLHKSYIEVLFACSFSSPALSCVFLTGEAHFDLLSLTGR